MIRNIEVFRFGPFEKKQSFRFKPGLNVICGKNASGKTAMMISIAELLGCSISDSPVMGYVPLKKGGYFRLETEKGVSSITVDTRAGSRGVHFKHSKSQEKAMGVFEPFISLFLAPELISKFIETSAVNPKRVLLIDHANVNESYRRWLAKFALEVKNIQIVITTSDATWKGIENVNFIEIKAAL